MRKQSRITRKLAAKVRHTFKVGVSTVRDRRVRLASPAFYLSSDYKKAKTPEQLQLVEQMRRDGIIKLPGFIDPATLADMQAGIQRMVAEVSEKYRKDPYSAEKAIAGCYEDSTASFYDEKCEVYTSHDPFRYSTGLIRFVMSDKFMSLVNSYYRKQAVLARAIGFRMLPKEGREDMYGCFWHHDSWGRKVNATLLLTEIGENDQCVSYKKGTHLRYNMGKEAPMRDPAKYETLKCTGKPGDVYLFDSNGLHRLNSSDGKLRDVYVLMMYCDGTFSFSQTIPDEIIKTASRSDLRVFKETLKANELRRRTGRTDISPQVGLGWYSTLPHVSHWLF